MKTMRLFAIALVGLSACLGTLNAQIYSARRLTQRIAPQLPAPRVNAGRAAVTPQAPGVAPQAPSQAAPPNTSYFAPPRVEEDAPGSAVSHEPQPKAPAVDQMPLRTMS